MDGSSPGRWASLVADQTAFVAHESAPGPNHSRTKESARLAADSLAAQGCADAATALRERYRLGQNGG